MGPLMGPWWLGIRAQSSWGSLKLVFADVLRGAHCSRCKFWRFVLAHAWDGPESMQDNDHAGCLQSGKKRIVG